VASEVFLASWRQLSSYEGNYFPGWVFGIARNRAIGEIRRLARARTTGLDNAAEVASQAPGPPEQLERQAGQEQLYAALGHLKETPREIVVLKFLLGMSNAEVASLMGKTQNAVNAQQHRALRSLQRIMKKESWPDA